MIINKDYKIESDTLNVTLFKKGVSKKTGKDTWRIEGYFSTIKNALHHLVELEVKLTEMKDFNIISKKQEELHKLIENLEVGRGL